MDPVFEFISALGVIVSVSLTISYYTHKRYVLVKGLRPASSPDFPIGKLQYKYLMETKRIARTAFQSSVLSLFFAFTVILYFVNWITRDYITYLILFWTILIIASFISAFVLVDFNRLDVLISCKALDDLDLSERGYVENLRILENVLPELSNLAIAERVEEMIMQLIENKL